jgi:hypothetical protein
MYLKNIDQNNVDITILILEKNNFNRWVISIDQHYVVLGRYKYFRLYEPSTKLEKICYQINPWGWFK